MVLIELDIRELDLPNNAKYTFNMTCYLDWKKDNEYITDYDDQIDKMDEYKYGNKNTFSFEFTIDNEAPQIVDAAVRKVKSGNSYRYSLELSLYDNHYLQGFGVYTYGGKETISGYERLTDVTSLKNGLVPANGEFNTTTLCSMDISGYWNKILENDGKLYLTLYDYAKNSSSFELVVSEIGDTSINPDAEMVVTPKEDLTISKNRNVRDDYTIKVNEQLDFSTLITVRANINDKNDLDPIYQEGYWMKDLKWIIADPTVADITNDGVLTGLKEGETTLIVHTPNVSGYDANDPTHSLKFTIKVSGEQAGGLKISGVEMSATSLSLERGETITVSAKIKPYTYKGDFKLNWSTSAANNVSIAVSEDGMSVEIKALKSGSATIQANVAGSYISGYCDVTVLQEFTVSDNIYLRSYTGRGGDWTNEKGEVEHNVVEIPKDLGVAYIYPSAFYGNEYIEKVIIPEGITSIMRATFFNCSNLKEVVLPESLTSIEYMAFANCNKLEKINLENVQSVGDSAFWGCAMEELNLSKCTYIDKYAFVYNSNLKKVDLSRVGMIGGGAFAHCNALTSVVIPENTSMGYDTLYLNGENYSINRGGAFAFCTNLKSVVIKSKTVGESAFFACFNLESVIFENDVDEIGVNAFGHCYALENVTFYGKAYKIDDYAFLRCRSLKEITLPDGLTIMGGNVFLYCDKLATVKISSGALLDTINSGSLGGLDIEEFVVENGNKYLSSEDGVLYDRAKKKLIAYPSAKVATDYTFTVPATVKTIGESAFAGVRTLIYVDLGNVEYIEAEAFREMSYDLHNGRIVPVQFIHYNNVKYIGDYAFSRAFLAGLPLSDDVTTHIGAAAFYGTRLVQGGQYSANATLIIPKNLRYLGDIAFAGFLGITNDGDEVLVSSEFTSVTFAGSSIKSVGIGAFAYNPKLRNIDFGNLEEISDSMFAGCTWTTVNDDETETTEGLISVKIPDTIKAIGTRAFMDCTELTNVEFLGESKLTKIADGAFAGTGITSITLPDSIESIGANAFEESKLKSITLPAKTTTIGNNAFASTPLTEVNYKSGTGAVKTIGNSAFEKCESLTKAAFPLAEVIGDSAFSGCKKLSTINLAAVKTVGADAFNGCEALAAITLTNAETVGARAFKGAVKVTAVSMPKVQKIGAEAFSGTAVKTIALPACFTTAADKAFFGAENLASITVDEKNATYTSMDGVLYSVNGNGMYSLVSYPAGKTDNTDYTVYDKTIKLNAYAFNGNKTLKNVTLPVFLQVIGMSAMSGMTNLTSLTINAVNAPSLESYATMVEQEKENDENDDASGPVGDDDVVGDDDIENDNELVDRNEYEFINKYDNFSFAFEDAGNDQQLKIYIPYNNSGYDSRIWKQYVGKCIKATEKQRDKVHATLGTLEFIENVQAELEKDTHDADEIRRLISIYNIFSEIQQQFIIGNYDYEIKDSEGKTVASIDKAYYQNMLKGRNYYKELTALQGKAANASSMNDEAQHSVASVTTDSTLSVVIIAALCLSIAVIVSSYAAKRRGK
ncbi:MAG: leucine-rich repeat protein [Clostridiales bacterium]|nr:leucine-rich repeat protein [Clostridiales bacterium]